MKNILQYFEKTCERFPDHIAVADDHASVTFHDLKRKKQHSHYCYNYPQYIYIKHQDKSLIV